MDRASPSSECLSFPRDTFPALLYESRINVDCRSAGPIKRVKNGKGGRKIQRRAGDNVFRWLCVATNFYLSVVCRVQRIEKQLTARGVVYGTMHSGFRNE